MAAPFQAAAAQRPPGTAGPERRLPLAWIAALAGLSLLGRTRDVLTLLAWARTTLTVATRVAGVLGIVSRLRGRRAARAAAAAGR